jgi:hypothetical protein
MKTHKVKAYSMYNNCRVSTFTIIAILLLLAMSFFSETRAESCTCPELGNLLVDSRDLLGLKDDTLPMARGICLQPPHKGTDIQWFGVALEEPIGGALFALDCSGNVLGVTTIGSVVKLVTYPPLDDVSAVVKVDYIARVAQRYGLQKVALVALKGKKIHELWGHDSFEANFIVPTKDGTETTYSFQFSPDGKTIAVTGKKKIYPASGESFIPENITTHTLKPQRFCWEPSKGTFKECGDR